MKSPKTKRRDTFKSTMERLLTVHPEAKLVKNKYKSIKAVLGAEWLNTLSKIDNPYEFIQDVTYVDRLLRKQTEGVDNKAKAELEKEWLEENYQPTP